MAEGYGAGDAGLQFRTGQGVLGLSALAWRQDRKQKKILVGLGTTWLHSLCQEFFKARRLFYDIAG